MLNNFFNNQNTTQAGVIAINSPMTQFELINAIYDSKILTLHKLTASSRLVLLALARHYNPANDDFFPSYSCITEHTGVSKKSVERAIKELTEKGLITYRTEKVNRYRFTGHFFAQLKMSPNLRQYDDSDLRQNDDLTNKKEKINKKGFFNNFLGGLRSQNIEAQKSEPCRVNEINKNNAKSQQNQANLIPARAKNLVTVAAEPSSAQVLPLCREKNNTITTFGAVNSGTFASAAGYVRTNYSRKSGFQYENAFSVVTSHVPSVAETRSYLEDLRSSRKLACAPIDFDEARAIAWYNSLSPVLRKSDMAKKVAKKFSISASA